MREGIIRKILADHFSGFWELHATRFPKELRPSIEETVQKAMRCGTTAMGYAKYECVRCEEAPPKLICFTCKSRFCHGCGKKYTDEWAEKQEELIFDVPHRHTVFTVPQELREVFFQDREKLKELAKKVAEVFQFFYHRKSKKRELEVGVLTVIHTFGRDLKFNPHIHALVTEGALDRHKEWVPHEFIPYEYLRKSWQKLLLDLMKVWFPEKPKALALINDLYARYPHGFYVNAEKKMNNARGAAKYIGRYLARPAIAEYRIESYDYKTVRFWYEDHRTGKRIEETWPVYRFLFSLLQHISPKHFRMVGRFGLYSRKKHRQTKEILKLYLFVRVRRLSLLVEQVRQKKRYRDRMIASFAVDPLRCASCASEMVLMEIVHPEIGHLYHHLQEMTMKITKGRGSPCAPEKEKRLHLRM